MPPKLPSKSEWRKERDKRGWPKSTAHVVYVIEQTHQIRMPLCPGRRDEGLDCEAVHVGLLHRRGVGGDDLSIDLAVDKTRVKLGIDKI